MDPFDNKDSKMEIWKENISSTNVIITSIEGLPESIHVVRAIRINCQHFLVSVFLSKKKDYS